MKGLDDNFEETVEILMVMNKKEARRSQRDIYTSQQPRATYKHQLHDKKKGVSNIHIPNHPQTFDSPKSFNTPPTHNNTPKKQRVFTPQP